MPVKHLQVDLHPEREKADIAGKRRVLSRVLEGAWAAILKGRGMEFAGFRQYTYGDDASRIDWNATLRSKEVLVREFEEYKVVNIYFLLDVSETMLFSSAGKLKCEYAAELLFHLAEAVIESGNSVGYALFSDRIVAKHAPGLGRDVLYPLAAHLMDGRNYGGKRDFRHCMNVVHGLLRQRSLIILVSDFVDMPEGWDRYMRMFSMQNDLIGIMVRDVRDCELPEVGMQAVVANPSDASETLLIDLKQYAALYREDVEKEERYIKAVFAKAKAGMLKVTTDQEPFGALNAFFRRHAKSARG